MLIDDPFASMEDALSEATRKNVWDWYSGTAYNRLMPGGAIILINHRMHEDDLAGRVLAQQAAGGDRWEVVELPAISEDGAALWPDAYPIEALSRIRQNTQPRFWSALYQQHPTPEEREFFKSEWLRPYTTAPDPKTLSVYAGSDFAVTSHGGDFTVHIVVGIDPEDKPWLLDLWRGQTSSDVWVETLCDSSSASSLFRALISFSISRKRRSILTIKCGLAGRLMWGASGSGSGAYVLLSKSSSGEASMWGESGIRSTLPRGLGNPISILRRWCLGRLW
jgi:hypothetical protein